MYRPYVSIHSSVYSSRYKQLFQGQDDGIMRFCPSVRQATSSTRLPFQPRTGFRPLVLFHSLSLQTQIDDGNKHSTIEKKCRYRDARQDKRKEIVWTCARKLRGNTNKNKNKILTSSLPHRSPNQPLLLPPLPNTFLNDEILFNIPYITRPFHYPPLCIVSCKGLFRRDLHDGLSQPGILKRES